MDLTIDGRAVGNYFILVKNNTFSLDIVYLSFIHQAKLYGAKIGGQMYNVSGKLMEKYEGFQGDDNDFLSMDKHNFIIDAEEIKEVLYQKRFQPQNSPFTGKLEILLQSGKAEKYYVHSGNHIPAMLMMFKNDLTENLVLKDGKHQILPEEYPAFAMEKSNSKGMIVCTNCDKVTSILETAHFPAKNNKDIDKFLCPDCFTAHEEELQQETEGVNAAKSILFSLGAAVICSLLWYGFVIITNMQAGVIAVLIGWIVANTAIYGAGKKRGTVVQGISAVATLFAMMFSEYLIIRHFAVLELAAEGITGIPLFLPVEAVVQLITVGIQTDPITLVFWGIAIYQGYRIPASRYVKSQKQQEVDEAFSANV
ncbi:MgtC/SapB family protein [Dethiobacter alkaliphilus]|uniref:Uncharacterized protein n=1 Tax=Dethiobacter alkaliphilus AHT 1 TaxID=555088 RepID=C0GK91_DETAL|nr:MgtC/SapB family protein [Dethiobacter alkaliphilus]EEG76274.1 hypothetical protein DealDRAFT_2900 [Dethiobacter alkaliphilus AHT 1]